MQTMTRDQERLLSALLQVAGRFSVLLEALEQLTQEKGEAPSLEDLVHRILEIRETLGGLASPLTRPHHAG